MKFLLANLCLLADLWVSAMAAPHQHMVLSVVTTTRAQSDILVAAAETDPELDFWTHPRVHGVTDVMVPWQRFNQLRQEWTRAGMEVKVIQQDVAKLIRNVEEENRRLAKEGEVTQFHTTLYHSVYRSYNQFVEGLTHLAKTFPSLTRFDVSAETPPRNKTIEGRKIHLFELGANMGRKPIIMLEVNLHAREWLTSAANFYMVDWLLTNYGRNSDATVLLDDYHLVIIPVANPDGYEYSRNNSDTRLWRKNRRDFDGSFNCKGVDLNRNFDAYWLGGGFCTASTYPGTSPASEPETQAVEKLFQFFQHRMVMYLPVHCYSQVLLLPWAYLRSIVPATPLHKEMGDVMSEAMEEVAGRQHLAGTVFDQIGYNAYGSVIDWVLLMKGGDRTFLSVAYELRPKSASEGGFIMAASHIVPAGKELLASVVAAAEKYTEDILDDDTD